VDIDNYIAVIINVCKDVALLVDDYSAVNVEVSDAVNVDIDGWMESTTSIHKYDQFKNTIDMPLTLTI
jgi:hypothetical protein